MESFTSYRVAPGLKANSTAFFKGVLQHAHSVQLINHRDKLQRQIACCRVSFSATNVSDSSQDISMHSFGGISGLRGIFVLVGVYEFCLYMK